MKRLSESDNKLSKKLGGFADISVNSKEELNYYQIKNTSKAINDFVSVQKAVVEKLKRTNFFNNHNRNIAVNSDTDIVVEIGEEGIRETLSAGKRYATLPRKIKTAKIATIKSLPEIIKYAEVVNLNQKNYHGNNMANFLVLKHPVEIDGEPYNVEIKIKKTPQKNKFYIHNLTLINNKEMNSLIEENAVNSDVTSIISENSSLEKSLSQDRFDVKSDDVNNKSKKSLDVDNEDIRFSLKEQQFDVIQNSNLIDDNIHTGINSVDDIHTYQEVFDSADYANDDIFTPDYTRAMARRALKNGKITVYSSYDDSGNVIPLNERFNSKESDIRYSKDVEDFDISQYNNIKFDASESKRILSEIMTTYPNTLDTVNVYRSIEYNSEYRYIMESNDNRTVRILAKYPLKNIHLKSEIENVYEE
jgi:hypothetical protein